MSSNSEERFPDNPLTPAGIALYSFIAFAAIGGMLFFCFRLILPYWRGRSALQLFSPAILTTEAAERAAGIPVTGWDFLRPAPWAAIAALLIIILLYWVGPLLTLRGIEGLRRWRASGGTGGSPLPIGLSLSTGAALLLYAFFVPVLIIPLQYVSYRTAQKRAVATIDRQVLLPDMQVMALNAQAWYARNGGDWMDSAGAAKIDTGLIRSNPPIVGSQLAPQGDSRVNRYLLIVSTPKLLSLYGVRADPGEKFTRTSLLKACKGQYRPVYLTVTPERTTISSYG